VKIENSVSPAGTPAVKEAPARAGKAPTAPAGAAGGGAVNLSALSSRMQSIEAALSDVPVIDRARVEEIKQAMAEGRFKVNTEVVADKLIDTVRELIRSRST
jgi:negative regulator of flagellin synthesis FlgM